MAGFLEAAKVQSFSMCFNSDGTPGVLGLNAPASSGEQLMQSIGSAHWGLEFHGVSVSSASSSVMFCNEDPSTFRPGQTTACGIIPDSGTTLILGQPDHLSTLFTQMCDSWNRCSSNYSSSGNSWSKSEVFQALLYDCHSWMSGSSDLSALNKELPSIWFNVAGAGGVHQSYELSAYDYVMMASASEVSLIAERSVKKTYPTFLKDHAQMRNKEDSICMAAFGEQDYVTKANGPVWILGTPLFYRYNVKFSLASPASIGFNPAACGTCSGSLMSTKDLEEVRQPPTRLRKFPQLLRNPRNTSLPL